MPPPWKDWWGLGWPKGQDRALRTLTEVGSPPTGASRLNPRGGASQPHASLPGAPFRGTSMCVGLATFYVNRRVLK